MRVPLLVLVLLSIVAPRFCCQIRKQIAGPVEVTNDCPLFPSLRAFFDFERIPFLTEFFKCLLWFFHGIVDTVYFILNTVLVTCCEITVNLFSGIKQIIKLVEFLGYCVRVILNVNYNFVSSLLTCLRRLLELIVEGVRYAVESLISVTISVFFSILKLLHDIVRIIPRGFQSSYEGVLVTKRVTGAVLYESYLGWEYILSVPSSAVTTVITTTKAVLECLMQTLLNTVLLTTNLILNSVLLSFQMMTEAGSTLWSYIVSGWDCMVHYTRLVGCGLRHSLNAIIYMFISIFKTVVRCCTFLVQVVFQQISALFHTVGYLVVNTVSFIWSSMNAFLVGISALFQHFMQSLQTLLKVSVQRTPGGIWTVGSVLTCCFVMYYSWVAFEVNLFVITFELMKELSQSVMTRVSARSFIQQDATQDQRPTQPGSCKENGTGELRAELERERDKNLCVVCQDQQKSMLVMPCRHMCLCRGCSGELLRLRRWQSRTCPLCRCRITSILEVYV